MATVLVVDDDATNREYLRTLLVHRGHRVREAADGDSALRMAGREPLDAVITDVLMPGLDGYELARQLRSRPATSRVPIAFNTAHYGQQEIQPLARACGVQDVILKPASPRAVLDAIDALLSAGSVACTGTAAAPEFAHRHRHALKQKLLETTTALRAAGDRETRLRLHAALLQDRLAETQRVTQADSWDFDPRSGVIVLSEGLRDRLRLPSSRVLQRRLWRRVHPDDVDRMTAAARETLRTGRPHNAELRVADLDGVVHEIVVSCRVTADGALWGVTQDVSEARAEQVCLRMLTDRQTERRVLDQLRQAVLTVDAPAAAGVDLAAECLAGPDRLDVGGDWHDILPFADGRVLMSVGTVAGYEHHASPSWDRYARSCARTRSKTRTHRAYCTASTGSSPSTTATTPTPRPSSRSTSPRNAACASPTPAIRRRCCSRRMSTPWTPPARRWASFRTRTSTSDG